MLQEDFEILEECGSGAEAVAAFRRHAPQLMVMDVVMPGMSGIEAARQIMNSPGPHPKILMLSGITDDNVVLQAMEAGVSDYLFKPPREKKLKEVLRDFVAMGSGEPD